MKCIYMKVILYLCFYIFVFFPLQGYANKEKDLSCLEYAEILKRGQNSFSQQDRIAAMFHIEGQLQQIERELNIKVRSDSFRDRFIEQIVYLCNNNHDMLLSDVRKIIVEDWRSALPGFFDKNDNIEYNKVDTNNSEQNVVSDNLEDDKDEIYPGYKMCIGNTTSTYDFIHCTQKGYEYWDKKLNENYKKVLECIDDENKNSVKKAQILWVQYKESMSTVMSTLLGDASLERLAVMNFLVRETKKQAKILEGFIE